MWRLPDLQSAFAKSFWKSNHIEGCHHFEVLGLAWIIADSSILSSQTLE
jgi:hypothetical protein